jgi:AmmeMemoRadiSam system protein A
MAEHKSVGVDLGLSRDEKEELRRIAREAIAKKLRGDSSLASPSSEKLKAAQGAFVSLHKRGMLRGCIGTLQTNAPLYKTVEEMAKAAAFEDPRFSPLTEEELAFIDLEISVLTPFEEIKDPEQIQVGLHGLLIRRGSSSGLLLPQVAADRKWNRQTFLEETCRKAGLPKDAWRDPDAKVYVFSADVF